MIKEYFHIAHLISRHLSGEVHRKRAVFWINGAKRAKAMSSFSKRFVVMNIMHSTKFVKWSLIRRLDGKVSKHVSRGWSSEGDI